MRKVTALKALATVVALGALAGCGSNGGAFDRARPNEFAVTRNAPLVVPPDFALVPPRPGAPRPQEADSSTQALQAMFGGQARRTPGETAVVGQAGNAPEPGVRSEVGDPGTSVVNKGSVTRDIIAAPAGAGQEASVTTPQ